MTAVRVALLAVAVLGGIAHDGAAAVLCRARSGKLGYRAACRKGEQPLDPAALDRSALAGDAGPPGAPGARGQHVLRIVDVNGTEVGTIVEFFPSGAQVVIDRSPLTVPVIFLVDVGGLTHNIGGAISAVVYQSNDCSGSPYVRDYSDGLPAGHVFGQVYGTSLYFPSGPVANSLTVHSSEIDPNGGPCGNGATPTGRGTCCSAITETLSYTPAARVAVSALGLVPPFKAVPR